MKKILGSILMILLCLPPPFVRAFEFSTLSNGDRVTAGSTIEVKIDPGDIPPLFGVLFMASRGLVEARLDSSPPFDWSIQIPKDYYGPLTLWAVGRRYYPVPDPPRASVTIFVVFPALRLSLKP